MTTLLAAVDTALGEWNAYRYGDLDGKTLPHIFALVSVERRFVTPERNGGMSGRSGWRVSVRYVGRSPKEAEWAGFLVNQALDGTRLTIDGYESTPVTHESTAAVRSDEGRFSGESFFTYTL